MIGKALGHYQVVEKLGAGGMGEVYRATDPRLGRDVAIKVLPEGFARDPERLARFEREARVLASLNHQNIAANLWVRAGRRRPLPGARVGARRNLARTPLTGGGRWGVWVSNRAA